MVKTTYEINFVMSFWEKGNEDSAYPLEDKVWFDVYLDDRWWYEDGSSCLGTYDCEGFELPIKFLALPERKRNEMLPELLDRAIPIAAELLERNKIDEYEVCSSVDLMDIDYMH